MIGKESVRASLFHPTPEKWVAQCLSPARPSNVRVAAANCPGISL